MKALVYHGPGQRSWDEVPYPVLQADGDVIVKISSSTICGTDLHILKGDVPAVAARHDPRPRGRRHGGREGSRASRRSMSATACSSPASRPAGGAASARRASYGLCSGGGGWIFGHLIDGLQAEYARVPFADTSVYKLPDGLTDEQALFVADILPTAFEVGVLAGGVQPGDTVAIVGAGPIGLAAIMTAKLLTPGTIVAIDLADSRLERRARSAPT